MSQETEYDSRRYSQDRPKSCEFCFFWVGKKHGCELPQCYYLLPEEAKAQPADVHKEEGCRSCPYGRHSPCIGYCLVKIMREMKVGRYAG